MNQTKRKRSAPRARNEHPGAETATIRLSQALQQMATLALAVYGFLFCLISSYQLNVTLSRLVLTATILILLFTSIYSNKRRGVLLLIFFLLADFWGWRNADALLQGLLLLLEQALSALALHLPDALSGLLRAHEAAQALLYATMALQALLFLVTLAAGFFVICRSSAVGLALSTLPLLLPAPFYLLAPPVLPFFCLVAAYLMLYILNGVRYAPSPALQTGAPFLPLRRRAEIAAQRSAQHMLPLTALPLIALALALSLWMLPEKGYVRPEGIEALQQKIFSLQLGQDSILKSNDGLTHGDLRNLSAIRFTGEPALKVRTTLEQPLYLRDFAGASFSANGWTSVSDAAYSAFEDRFLNIAPQNLSAAAVAVASSSFESYTVSVRNLSSSKTSIWTPNALVTTAADLPGAVYLHDAALGFSASSLAADYTVEALRLSATLSSVPLADSNTSAAALENAYRTSAGSALGLTRAGGADAQRVQSSADGYIAYLFETYTALPEDTMRAAQQLLATYGLALQQENGALDLYETCRALYLFLSARCAYAYSPPAIPEGADFATYFIEESRRGYCVHFATTATVLLRGLGIPARYAEGYIVIPADYEKQPDAEGYITIEDTHAHAWVEVFDPVQLEWIPVEMTASTGSGSAPSAEEEAAETESSTSPALSPATEPTPAPEPTPTAEPTVAPAEESSESADLTPGPDHTDSPEPDESAGPDELGEDEAASSLSAITPTPAPGGQETSDPEETSLKNEERSAGARLWPLVSLAIACASALAVFGLRKLTSNRLKRRFSQRDSNAAVLALCRYALNMLRFAGCAPLNPLQYPLEYVQAAVVRLPWLNQEGLLRILEFAQLARFSDKTCSRLERDETAAFVRSLSGGISSHLPRLRRWLFSLRFPAF